MSVKSYRDLTVWQKAIALTKRIYLACESFPPDERFGLSSQIKRSAVSVGANLAEGHARATTREYLRFINIAYSSLAETETHVILAYELDMLSGETMESLPEDCATIGRMLNGLRNKLEQIQRTRNASRTLNPGPRYARSFI